MARIRVTQVKSTIGRPAGQRDTVRRLGLHKIGQSVVHEDTPDVRGMAFKVRHLVSVEPAGDTDATYAQTRAGLSGARPRQTPGAGADQQERPST